MKDKSRIISSVIVSLLAGFIYLLSGNDIPVNIQSSVKAVLSSNEPDMYLTAECFPFYEISNKSDRKVSINNSSFYLKRNKTGDKQYSEINSGDQAKFVRPLPDKNIDFTSELNKLINSETNDVYAKNIDHSGNSTILSCNEFQIADAERNFKRNDRVHKQNIEFNLKYDDGNGFVYNYLTEKLPKENSNCDIQIINSTSGIIAMSPDFQIKVKANSNCNENVNVNRNSVVHENCNRNKVTVVSKIEGKIYKLLVNSDNDENDEIYDERFDERYDEEYDAQYNENIDEDYECDVDNNDNEDINVLDCSEEDSM